MKVRIQQETDTDAQISIEELVAFTNAVRETVDSIDHRNAYVSVSIDGLIYEKG